jgi:mRNA interferase MazF
VDIVRRGDVVVIAIQGDYGKPRPALVIQSDLFNETHASITVAPVTTAIVDAPLFRLTIDPTKLNGLKSVSQIMVDKIIAVRRDKVGKTVGRLDDGTMVRVNRAIGLWLGLAA